MSKMDNLRAMREAKYAKAQAAAKTTAPTKAKAPVAPAAATKRARPVVEDAAEPEGERLCGHKNMSGRTCTREHGHAAKSHRYS